MLPGELFDDRFELVTRAGVGGMGAVWRALDRRSGELVALKVLREASAEGAGRFLQEARILATFVHPNVVRYVGHAISSSGEPYLVMEWLEGQSLLSRLERGAFCIDESVSVARQIATALAAAHARGITHRDIKPSNIFLVGESVTDVRILDFGIARLSGATSGITRTGSILGTPGYMAPEQARGEREAGARADVFALGCVLFECLAGKPAFQGAHPMALLAKLLLEEAPRLLDLRPDVPQPLASLCARMMAKEPERRPADGAAVLAELERDGALRQEGVPSGEVPRTIITGTERRLVSIVAAWPRGEGAAETRELVAAVERAALPLGARVEMLASGAVVAVLLGEGSVTDQATSAARCASWVRLSAPSAAVVLVTGRGESTNKLPVGEALERAAALLDEARQDADDSSSVWIDDTTRGLLDPRFLVAESKGHFLLRGERAAGQETRTLLGKPSPFVGRDRELRNILDLVAESFEERRPVVVLVTAPPGMGKSRLRQELVRVIRERHPDCAFMMARPDVIGAGSAYALLSGALRDVLAISAGEPIEAQRRKLEVFVSTFFQASESAEVAEFLGELAGTPFPDERSPRLRAARQSPLFMADRIESAYVRFAAAVSANRSTLTVLEDLHWGDAPSIKVIDTVLRDLTDRPLAVLAFARPEVHDLFPRLWAGRNVQEIRLGPLPRRAASELVQSALAGVASPDRIGALVERAEGNAFYLEELIRAVAEGRGEVLPDTVLGMVEARLSSLSPEARRLLRAASIFGEVFWEGGVRELCGQAEVGDLLSELCAKEIIARRVQSRFAGQAEYAFRHALLREGAYAMLVEFDRLLGHRIAGSFLESSGELDARVLGEHCQRGGDPQRAAAHFLRAASQSFDKDDLAGALQNAQRGIECAMAGEAPGEVLGNLKALCVAAHCWRSEFEPAHRIALSALPLVVRGSRWECLLLFHGTWAALVRGAEDDFTKMATKFADFQPDSGALREFLLWAPLGASLLTTYGRRELCRLLLERAEVLAATLPSLDLDLEGTLAIGRSDQIRAFERRPSFQLGLTARAVSAFEAIGDIRNQITALNRNGQALGEIGDPEAGEGALRRAVELAHRIRGPFVVMQSELHLAALLSRTSDASKWEEAEKIADKVLSSERVSDGYRGWAHGIRAQIALHRGDAGAVISSAGAALPLCARVPLRHGWITTLLVRGLILSGQTDEARRFSSALAAELASLGGGGYIEIEARLAMADAALASGDAYASEARSIVRELLHKIDVRASEIKDRVMRARYLENVPEIVRARALAAEMDASPREPIRSVLFSSSA